MAEPSTNGRSRSSITRLRGNKEASCGFDSVLFFLFFFFFFGVAGFGMIDGFSIRRVRDVFLAKGRIFLEEEGRIYRLVLDQFYLGVSFFVVQENKFTLLVDEISSFFFFF